MPPLIDEALLAWDGGAMVKDGRQGNLKNTYPSEAIRAIDPLLVDSRFYDASAFTMHRDLYFRNRPMHQTSQGENRLEEALMGLEHAVGPANMIGQKIVVFIVPRFYYFQAMTLVNLSSAEGITMTAYAQELHTDAVVIPREAIGDMDLADNCTVDSHREAQYIAPDGEGPMYFAANDHIGIVVEIVEWPPTGLFTSSRGRRPGSMYPDYTENACARLYPHMYISALGRDACFRAEHALCNWMLELETCPDTDGDGCPDHLDDFPDDPNEQSDSDGDGVGDNADAFPNDPTEDTDADGDGVGANTDADDNDPEVQ